MSLGLFCGDLCGLVETNFSNVEMPDSDRLVINSGPEIAAITALTENMAKTFGGHTRLGLQTV